MVIGIVPNISKAETLLNNLSEADFDLSDVSVIASDLAKRNAIAPDAGPFKGVSAVRLSNELARLGLSKAGARAYGDAVAKGGVFVAVSAPKDSESAAVEMLKDYGSRRIRIIDR